MAASLSDLYILTVDGQHGAPVIFQMVAHGNNYRIVARSDLRGEIVIKGHARAVIDALGPIVDSARASVGEIAPGHVRANGGGS